MKHQALFSSKDKGEKTKVLSAAIFVWQFKGLLVPIDCKDNCLPVYFFCYIQ